MAKKASTQTSENKLSENIGSIILGFVVVLILGGFLLNVFRGNRGEVGESGETEEEQEETIAGGTTYTVQPGDTLWLIAERETGSGFNWQAIADANNLASADDIEEGMTLVIPEITGETIAEAELTGEPTVEPTMELTATATIAPTTGVTATPTPTMAPAETRPSTGQYTVQTGDSLWKIAVAQYNNGYRWVDIARANNLDNPDIIHTGNVLTLP
ncbi:LysM peptidoglycan-binding domain-containing protein [Candidatus Roizmanbacteria bacterium]|nr:LysM peptidoglycan-binding domain-containing protein [Candidatus Roizmanbacteria bacterium]